MTEPGRARNGSAELTGAKFRYSDNLGRWRLWKAALLMSMKDMEIHLRLFGLGEQAAGRTEDTILLVRGSTVGSLVEALRTEGSYLSAYLPFDPSTELRTGPLTGLEASPLTGPGASPSTGLRASFAQAKAEDRLLILVNGRSVHVLQGLDTPLTDGDRVTIMPKAFGG